MTDVETPTMAAIPPVEKEENAEVDSDEEDLFDDNEDDPSSLSVEKSVATSVDKEEASKVESSGERKVKSETSVNEPATAPSVDMKSVGESSTTAASAGPVVSPLEHTSSKDIATATTESANADSTHVNGSDDLDTSKPIPRKSSVESSSGISSEAQNDSNRSSVKYFSGVRFGLDAAVKIPNSVDTKLLEGAILSKMKSLPPNLTNDALQEYDDALQVKGSGVRNRGAYLMGVLKRYVSVQERAKSGEGPAILPMGEGLTALIHSRLDTLVATGFCSVEEMNDKVKSKIRMLSEKDALFAIDELASAERSTIRNFGSYFMGILNRYMRGDKSSRAAGETPSTSNNGGGSRTNRFDRNKNNGNRGNDRNYRDGRNGNHYLRDRSRDRFDEESHRNGPYGPSNHATGHYGPNSNGNGNFGPGDRNQRPTYPDPYSRGPGIDCNALWQQQQQQQQQNPPFPSGPRGNHNAPMGNLNMGNPPPPPPVNTSFQHHSVPQPPNNQYGQQPPPPNSQQGPQGPPFGYPPQQNPPSSQFPPNPGQSHYPPHNGPPPPQHQSYIMPSNNSSASQNSYQHQGPRQQNQFVQNTKSFNNGVSSHANPHQQGPSYGGWQQYQHGPPHQQPPSQNHQGGLDILALADKASSALANVNTMGQPQGGASPQFSSSVPGYGPPPPPNNNPSSSNVFSHGNIPPRHFNMGAPPPMAPIPPQNNSRRNNNRHTTASMDQLPIAVQYAVQNLVATGHVEKPPDEGILGMIVDLPENMALQALQKFCSIDKSSMRSRTGYLIGLLRRELEKINKR